MSHFAWTLTDASPDSDPNGAPIAEGTDDSRGGAYADGWSAVAVALEAAGTHLSHWENVDEDDEHAGASFTADDLTVLRVSVERV